MRFAHFLSYNQHDQNSLGAASRWWFRAVWVIDVYDAFIVVFHHVYHLNQFLLHTDADC